MDEMKQSIATPKSEREYLNTPPAWRVFRRRTVAPKAVGQQDKVKVTGTEHRPSDPILARFNARLRRVVASWFSEETKKAYRQLLKALNSSSGAAIGRPDDSLSPRAAYFNDRLMAGQRGSEGL